MRSKAKSAQDSLWKFPRLIYQPWKFPHHIQSLFFKQKMILQDLIKSLLNIKTLNWTGESGGGCINEGEAYNTDIGKIFVKRNSKNEAKRMFDGEFASLEAIAATNTVKVPKPLIVSEISPGGAILIMEYEKMLSLSSQAGKLGEQMARLHLHNVNKKEITEFGFHTTTCCGYLPLNNSWNSDWVDFYAKQRITPQIETLKTKYGEKEAGELWAKLEPLLPVFFKNVTVKPSLLHGDLWGGNAAENPDGPVVFDPASFYGHSEFELSISKMFGGFNRVFFDEYHRLIPKEDGFEDRIELYKLFHYLNHWNHFGGGGYRSSSISTMKKLIKTAEKK